jgi:predicted N-acetyltransferase YhbS
MVIDHLPNRPQHVETVARWIYQEFGGNTSFNLIEITDFFAKRRTDKPPITLIAIDGDTCLGTVSLFEGDLDTRRDLTPWLAALYVDQPYRNQGIGNILTGEIITIARNLGYPTLYLRTEHAAGYYRKRNWELVCRDPRRQRNRY